MHRIAAEIAEEIGMLLQNLNFAARASEQEARHHSGRPPTGHNEIKSGHQPAARQSSPIFAVTRSNRSSDISKPAAIPNRDDAMAATVKRRILFWKRNDLAS